MPYSCPNKPFQVHFYNRIPYPKQKLYVMSLNQHCNVWLQITDDGMDLYLLLSYHHKKFHLLGTTEKFVITKINYTFAALKASVLLRDGAEQFSIL